MCRLVFGVPPGSGSEPVSQVLLGEGVLRGCHFLDTRHVLGGFRAEWSPRSDEPQLALQGTVAEREKTPEGQLFSVVAGCVLLVKAQVSVVWGLGQH